MTLTQEHRRSPDLFSLAEAPMSDLIAALEEEQTLEDVGGVVPERALQIADLLVAEAVRLIRLGARGEVADAAAELSLALIAPVGAELEKHHPEAYERVAGASIVLGAATAASSSGGELAVLRAWNEKGREAVAAISCASEQALPRSELRKRLGNLSQSHLSHLLADLEAAGLVIRTREGRHVTVHLGPIAHSPHVRELLPRKERRRYVPVPVPEADYFQYPSDSFSPVFALRPNDERHDSRYSDSNPVRYTVLDNETMFRSDAPDVTTELIAQPTRESSLALAGAN